MLKTIRKTLEWALLCGAAQSAVASTYDFSYASAASGKLVVGSFDGTTAGDFVTGISAIQASFDGHALVGPLFAYGYGGSGWLSVDPVISFTRAKNNFIFVDCAHFACSGDSPGSAYNFFVLRNSGSPLACFYFSGGCAMSDSSGSSSWTLTERSAPVPEPAPFALLAVGGIAAALLNRRRGRPRTAAQAGRPTRRGSCTL